MPPVLKVENLWKEYRLGVIGHGYLFRNLQSWWARVRAKEDPNRRIRFGEDGDVDNREKIWALKDVSLDVERGEVLGIIGGNGAGKSTLLKIISRVTGPTRGQVKIRGRVASLLEVGTGFHSELTGRENVFLNGAILGMTGKEIRNKFDSIVDFAGVENYIDTPVKRYSSGMYVRLAFAVAAHLDPDILLVDEVLSVGDAKFQKKSLSKMQEQANSGRTVLFVSHNLGSIRQLCSRCIWINKGKIEMCGDTSLIVDNYLSHCSIIGERQSIVFVENIQKPSQLISAQLIDSKYNPTQNFNCDESIGIELVYLVHKKLRDLYGCLQVTKSDGTPVLVSYSYDFVPDPLENLSPGSYILRLFIPPRTLAAGQYAIHFSTASKNWEQFIVDDCGTILNFNLDDFTTRKGNTRIGYFSTLLNWNVEKTS